MDITASMSVMWLGEFIAEVVLFLVPTYWFVRPFRWLAGATAAVDVVKWMVRHDLHAYAHLWAMWRVVEVCWLVWIASDMLLLLVPRLRRSPLVRLPYALVVAAAIVNGPPSTIRQLVLFQDFGLLIAAGVISYAVLTSVARRYEEIAIGLGLLGIMQAAAGEVVQRMGYFPQVGQAAWIAGLILVLHALLRYEPALLCPPVSADTAS